MTNGKSVIYVLVLSFPSKQYLSFLYSRRSYVYIVSLYIITGLLTALRSDVLKI